jgi:hypothetical protein
MIPFKGVPSLNPVQIKFEKLLGITKYQFGQIWDKLFTFSTKNIEIDILKLNEFLSHNDPEYDDENMTYKGLNVSMTEYIVKKFGKEANDFVDSLIN